jgi:hypothetical protein
MLEYIELGGQLAALAVRTTQLPYSRWRRSDFRRWFDEMAGRGARLASLKRLTPAMRELEDSGEDPWVDLAPSAQRPDKLN